MNETYTNGYMPYIINVFSLIAIISGILVIISKNPIVSVLFLIGLFLSIASYLILLGMGFIGISYLLVYVGAVSILFLFILMLINIRISELTNETSNSIPLVIIIAISFNYIAYEILPYSFNAFNNFINVTFKNVISNYYSFLSPVFINNDIYFVTANAWDKNLIEYGNINSIGNIMYTSYSIWLIITSIILLLAMVGAIVITIKQKV